MNQTIPASELLAMAGPALDRAGVISAALLASCEPSAPSTLTHELYVTGDLLDKEIERGHVEPTTLRAVNTACRRGLTWLQEHTPRSITTPMQESERA